LLFHVFSTKISSNKFDLFFATSPSMILSITTFRKCWVSHCYCCAECGFLC